MNFSFMMFYGRYNIYREGGLKTKSSIIGGCHLLRVLASRDSNRNSKRCEWQQQKTGYKKISCPHMFAISEGSQFVLQKICRTWAFP